MLRLSVKMIDKLPGEQGIKQTVEIIKGIVQAYKKNLKIRMKALRIVKKYRMNDNKMKALFYWIKKNIKYVRDINGLETLHTPDKILEIGAGDCDDFVILAGSMLESIGYPVIFVVTSNRKDKKFNHIFLYTTDGKKRYTFDATLKKFNMKRPDITREKIFK